MSLQLTFGTQQVHTSQRMLTYPRISGLLHKVVGYTNVGNYARFTVFKKLIAQLPLQGKSKVLDLGTGFGEYSFSLAQASRDFEIHALDIDPERISTVEKAIDLGGYDNIKTHRAHIEDINEHGFDLIFSVDVFEHISPEEMPFKTAFEKLKPRGHLLVKIPNKTQKTIFPEGWFEEHQEWLEDEHIGQVYDLKGLSERFRDEGFEVIFGSCSDGWLSRLGWELAYLGKKMGILTQLLSLPIAKLLIHLDRRFHSETWGNAIQVIGQKPAS
ncbi:MAG: methyltransferase domain-containing protein [Roseivirga sp.]|nr:methyltransferase domain-containing protein [Roseivirga sp.]